MSEAKQTPLLDLLRGIPADARMTYEHHPTHHQMIPVGRLAHEAAARIAELQARLALAEKVAEAADELEHMAGCANCTNYRAPCDCQLKPVLAALAAWRAQK